MVDPEIIRIKDQAWESLSKIPGVHAVGIGKKVVGRVRTDETVLTVFVTKKRPLEELSPQAVIPPVFEGVRTDIVESPIPLLLAGPVSVTEQAIPNGMRFTFTATPDPPPFGVRIAVMLRLHGSDEGKIIAVHFDSDGQFSLNFMLLKLAIPLGFVVDAKVGSNTLEVTPYPDSPVQSFDATALCMAMDVKPYGREFLRGGIQIQGGSKEWGGTLGCLATLAPTPQYPQGRVVGVTCSHVVRGFKTATPNLVVFATNTTIDLSVSDISQPIPAHTVIHAMFRRNIVESSAFYTTRANESLGTVANGLAAAINAAGLPGVSAAVVPADPPMVRIRVTGFAADGEIDCKVHGPVQFSGGSSLKADVELTASGDHVVTFKGSVNRPDIGVFVDIDNAGFATTFGVYHNPPEGQPLKDVAQAISTAINLWPAAQRGLVSAMAVGDKVTIAAAKYVRVWPEADIRVGQPVSFFGTARPGCCNFRIGRVVAARLDLDIALIQIDAGTKYKHHIQELNAVAGTQGPALGLSVQKRGAVSSLTEGMVSAMAVSGRVGGIGGLTRIYRNALVVDSTIVLSGGIPHPFSMHGDSGSAVMTTGPGVPRFVGVLFGGGVGTNMTNALVTPVGDIVSAFADLGLSFDPGVGVDLSAVHTVPEEAIHFEALDQNEAHVLNGAPSARGFAAFDERMREAEQQIASTPIGRECAELVRSNFTEALHLVNHNRRVATVWHRSGGPELLNAVLRVLRFDDEPLPLEINGYPLAECLRKLRNIFMRYASPQLSRDIGHFAALLTDLAGMTYPQVLATLRTQAGISDAR